MRDPSRGVSDDYRGGWYDALAEVHKHLFTAVRGPDVPNDNTNLEDLLWEAGELRRRTQDAHSKLNTLGAPREYCGGTLSISGRIEHLAHDRPRLSDVTDWLRFQENNMSAAPRDWLSIAKEIERHFGGQHG